MIYAKAIASRLGNVIHEYKNSDMESDKFVEEIQKVIKEEVDDQLYPETNRDICAGRAYRCWKGGLYYIDSISKHTETGIMMVNYHALYDEYEGYSRPYNMFASKVPENRDADNITHQEYRFEVYEFGPKESHQPNVIYPKQPVLLNIDSLERCIKTAYESGYAYVGLAIEMEGFEDKEVIINSRANMLNKLAYYKSAYDENLNHKYSKGIRIAGFTYGANYDNIYNDLVK